MTLRALDVLAGADRVACEDTRTTAKLLALHGLAPKTLPYHEHNAEKMRPKLLAMLADGQRIALVSDAGTPLVSDPGYKLVRACVEAGIAVHAVPGASAALAALVVSGLPSDRFLFAGFPPPRSSARRGFFAELAEVRASLILYESPRRLAETLADAAAVLGPRPAVVGRELTKLYEEIRRGSLAELAAHYAQAETPKGEVVLVIGPPGDEKPAIAEDDLDAQLERALAAASLRDAVAAVAEATGLPRKQVYQRALALGRR